jgi:ABC-type lipoprotein release transport system permease subunit
VIGVAQDVPQGFGMEKDRPAIYFPLRPSSYARPSLRGVTLMVRSVPGVDTLGRVRREISAMADDLIPFNARSMPEQIDQLLVPIRVATWTYVVIGLFGLVLALVGVAGVTAYSVTRRVREIGLRIALGARRFDVLALVVREGLVLVIGGTVIGLAGAWAGVQLFAAVSAKVGELLDESTSDPYVLLGAPLLFVVLVLLSCYLPGRKSLRIEPATALREE